MPNDDSDQRLHDTDAAKRTSPVAKTAGFLVIALLLLGIILLATGAVKFGPY